MTAPIPPEPSDGRDGVDARPWYQKKRYGIPLAVFALLILLVAIVPASDDTTQTAATGPTETVTEVMTETVTETATERVTEIVTERPTGQLNSLRRRLRERDQTINQLRQRIRSLQDRAAAAAEPPPEPEPASDCHPSYTPCVPITSDVDCEGGSGDGPEYTGRVTVIGPDEYDLDRDGDGVGCD